MSGYELHEVSRRYLIASKAGNLYFRWDNTAITVITERGLDILKFSHNVANFTKGMEMIATGLPNLHVAPCAKLFPPNVNTVTMTNQVLTRCVIDPNLWSHDEKFAKTLTTFHDFQWCSPDLFENREVLAILTNNGTVEFFVQARLDYISVLNLTQILEDANSASFKIDEDKIESTIKLISDACKEVLTRCICWGNKIKDNAYFVTAQRNGDLLFWHLAFDGKTNIKATMIHKEKLIIEECFKIKWISQLNNEFTLLCSFTNGKLYAYKYKICDNSFRLLDTICLWTYEDRMSSNNLILIKNTTNGTSLLICDKYRYVLVMLLDENCNVKCYALKNVNDHKIVSMSQKRNKIILGTVNCSLFEVHVEVNGSTLNVISEIVNIKENYADQSLIGFGFSYNKVIWALCLTNNKPNIRKLDKDIAITFLTRDMTDNTEIDLLLNNPKESLFHMSDCIELLKYKSNNFKVIPDIDYHLLYKESETNIYKMKVYLVLLCLFLNRVQYSENNVNYTLPETSVEKVKNDILKLHAIDMIEKIISISEQNGSLTNVQEEMYCGCKCYLEYYCKKYKANITDYLKNPPSVSFDLKYECQCCDESLVDFACQDGHLNQYCCISFTPILDDYVECSSCQVTARKDLKSVSFVSLKCTFCDLPLHDYLLPFC